MKIKTVLTKARKLIEKKERWAKGYFATNKSGDPVTSLQSKNAVCFCALGAIGRAAGLHEGHQTRSHPAALLLQEIVGCDVGTFNNRKTHRQVIAAFNKAINQVAA